MELLKYVAYLPRPSGGERGAFGVEDVRHIARWGALGFLGMGLYAAGARLVGGPAHAQEVLIDPCSSMHTDEAILRAFVQLQHYRGLNPWLFKMAMQNIDHLLHLGHGLRSGAVKPLRTDRALAFSYFKVGTKRLEAFRLLVSEQMGVDHALVVGMANREVFDHVQVHLLDIFHLCSQFNPDDLRERAEHEIAAMTEQHDRYGHRAVPVDPR
jgi:hypothetical protein